MSDRTARVRLGSQGRIVLPRWIRDQLAAEEGAEYLARVEGRGRLVLESREAVIERLRARVRGTRWPGEPLASDQLIERRRAEARRDAQSS